MKQLSYFEEIIVDNFAGGGGASTGIELASGRPVTIAINHDPDAILMHRTNHPYTMHLQASVWDVDPEEVCAGRPVGLAWFSPDCKHFSKAKGSALVDKNIRGLAWIVLRWAGTVRPRVIMLENVEEFQTWGPVRKGKPVKKKAGQTFQKFIQQLTDLGYVVEYREIIAADFGAPTTRKRFVLVARCDGKPIVWPERTHAPRDSEEVKSGKLLPWKPAADIIDWSLPAYSIFASKQEIKEKFGVNAQRPLAKNTLRRVIRGVDKFTIRSGDPFLIECNHGGDGHIRSTREPVNTLTAKYTGGIAQPVMAPFTFSNTGGSVGSPASEPVHTIRTAGGQILAAANLIQYHTEQTEKVRGQSMKDTIMTVDSSNRYGLVTAQLMSIGQTGGGDRIRDVRDPAPTTVSKQEACLISGQLVEYYGNGNPLDAKDPLHTVTAHDREAVVSAHIQKFFGGVIGQDVREPMPTITAIDHNAICAAHVVKFKGQELGQNPRDTLNTITAQGLEYADCRAVLVKADDTENLGYWSEIRKLLNEHCDYSLADDEVILLIIGGVAYFIADITLRMLTPRELYNAMGFPIDYAIDRDYKGNVYPKNKQVARCGNAVCPPLAEAMVKANFPEWHSVQIVTMAQLDRVVTA